MVKLMKELFNNSLLSLFLSLQYRAGHWRCCAGRFSANHCSLHGSHWCLLLLHTRFDLSRKSQSTVLVLLIYLYFTFLPQVAIEIIVHWEEGFGAYNWILWKNFLITICGICALVFGTQSAVQDIIKVYSSTGAQ